MLMFVMIVLADMAIGDNDHHFHNSQHQLDRRKA